MNDHLFLEGKKFIPANTAALSSGLSRDYVTRLCREEKILGRRIGTHWYVSEESFGTFLLKQEYAKQHRREALTQDRAQEYRAVTAGAAHHMTTALAAVRTPSTEAHALLVRALEKHGDRLLAGTARAASAPAGLAHATFSMPHLSAHAIMSFTEFFQKLTALTLAFAFTFGTYALVDPQYARYAARTLVGDVRGVLSVYHAATDGGLDVLVARAESQVAAAAEQPHVAANTAAVALADGMVRLARAVNANVDAVVYSIAFPTQLARPFGGIISSTRASVVVQVSTTSGAASQNASIASGSPISSSTIPVAVHVSPDGKQNQSERIVAHAVDTPVVERIVERQTVLAAGGVTEEILAARLQELDNKLSAKIFNLTSANSSSPYVPAPIITLAQATRIDTLSGVSVSGSTWDGGSITNAAITGGSVAASALSGVVSIEQGGTGTTTAPTYGQLLLGTAQGGYTLVATSSLGITGGGASTWGSITGTLSSQTDLQTALDGKLPLSSWYATTTTALAEGANLYYTSARATTSFIQNLAATTSISSITTLPSLSLPYAQLTGTPTSMASSTLLSDSNTFSGTNTFGNITAAGATSTSLAVTGITSALHLANGTGGVIAYTGTSCTNQFVRSVNGAGVATCASVNLATDTTGTLAVSNGGTGATSFSQGWVYSSGGTGALAASTSPTVNYLVSTSTAATSSFAGPLEAAGLNTGPYFFGAGLSVCSGSNKLTWSGGSFGCAIDQTGGGSGGGSWSTTTSQVTGQLINYPNNSSDIVAIGNSATTSASYWFDPNTLVAYLSGKVGIGTSTPVEKLSVQGNQYTSGTAFFGGAITATSSLSIAGNTTLANATSTSLAVTGLASALLSTNAQGSVVATSTISTTILSANTIALSTGSSGSDLNVSGSPATLGGTLTINIPTASGSARGLLSSSDWTTFNAKQAALAFSYPLLNSANTISLAFGTTTSNTWAGTQTFTNTISGSISGNAGTATALQNARTINGTSFDGTANITITAASSTLLADSNTFSGSNTFGNITATGATSTSLAVTSVTNALHLANGTGGVVAYTGSSCTNQFVRSVNGAGVATCASVNLGTDVTGTLDISANTNLTATYPLLLTNDTLSLAFGTTTSNTWAGTQTFTNAPTLSTFSGLIAGSNGATYAVATSSLDANITGNAGTVTNGVYTTTFGTPFYQYFNATTTDALAEGATNKYWSNTLFDTRLAATTTLPNLTTLANLASVGTITGGTWSGSFGSVSGANLTALTAANIAAGTAGISISGNAGTATALQNARTINGTSFDGTANITITAASSTLLADSNTFSGSNTFGNITATGATSTSLAVTSVTNALHLANGTGGVVAYTGSSCTNQFVRSMNGAGVATCASVQDEDLNLTDITLADFTNDANYAKTNVANIWSALQSFTNASTTLFSNTGTAYFGGTATSTFDSAGNLALVSNGLTVGTSQLVVSGGNVGVGTTTPWGSLSIENQAGTPGFVVGSSTATSFIVDRYGRGGFGTASPDSSSQLTVQAPSSGVSAATFRKAQAANDTGMYFTFGGGSAATTPRGYFGYTKTGSGASTFFTSGELADAMALRSEGAFQLSAGGGSVALTVDTTGNLGVGTTSPGSLLSIGNTTGWNFYDNGTTTSYAKGIDLKNGGCFAVNGNCIGAGSSGVAFPFTPGTNFGQSIQSTTTALWLNASGYSLFASSSVQFGTAGGSQFFWDGANSRLGVGTTTPWGLLSINPDALGSGVPEFVIGSSTATHLLVSGAGNVGIGTTTPAAELHVQSSSGNGDILVTHSGGNGWNFGAISTDDSLRIAQYTGSSGAYSAKLTIASSTGYVGIGTTTPFRLLSMTSAVSTAQAAIAYDTANNTDILTSSVGDLFLYPSGNDALFNNSNFWVCTGGSGATNGCPSGTPTGFGNLVVETAVGVGSSTPFTALSLGANMAIVTTEKSLSDGATIAIDWKNGNQQVVTLGGNRAITFSNYISGATLRLVICQDGTGSRTITSWPAAVLWSGGTAPTLTTTINKCDVLTFLTTSATGTVRVLGSSVLNF